MAAPAGAHDDLTACPAAREVVAALIRTADLLRRVTDVGGRRITDPEPTGAEMSGHLARLLQRLVEAGPARMRDLARDLAVAPPALAALVDAAQAAGLLTRQPQPGDPSATLLALTPAGAVAGDRIAATQRRACEHALAPLTAEQQRQLLGLLDTLRDSARTLFRGGV